MNEQIITLVAFVANIILWLGRDWLPRDKRINALILMGLTLAAYMVASLVSGEQWAEIVNVGNLIMTILTSAGINLGADAALAPQKMMGISGSTFDARPFRNWRNHFRSIVS